MPQPPHVETPFTASEKIRDIVIGMSDGLTAPFAPVDGLINTSKTTPKAEVEAAEAAEHH